MTDYLGYVASEYAVDAPATALHFERWFRNWEAGFEGATGAPKLKGKATDIDVGNLSGTTAIVDLGEAAKLLLTATSVHTAAASAAPQPSIGYQLSSNNGVSWGATVVMANFTGLGSGGGPVGGSVSASRIIDMTGFNAIRLAGTGTLSGSLIWVEGE